MGRRYPGWPEEGLASYRGSLAMDGVLLAFEDGSQRQTRRSKSAEREEIPKTMKRRIQG